MDIEKACVVMSKAGRDKGRLFYVLEADGQFASVADGRLRPVERPKRKKLKHIHYHGCPDTKVKEKLLSGMMPTNAELRKALSCYMVEQEGNTCQKTM